MKSSITESISALVVVIAVLVVLAFMALTIGQSIVEIVVSMILLLCVAAIVIAPTGFIERYFRFGGWFNDDSTKWGFRFSVIGMSVSVIALTLTFYFAWQDRNQESKLDEVIEEIQLLRSDINKHRPGEQ